MRRLPSFAASRTSSRRSRKLSLNQAGTSIACGLAVCAIAESGMRNALARASRSFISVRMDVRAVVGVAGNTVKLVAGLFDGVDVHHHRRKIAQVMEQFMAHRHGDGVAFRDRVPREDGNAQVGMQTM